MGSLFSGQLEEKPMVVVIPSYQNKRWSSSNIKSVLDQDYNNFRIIYVNDASSDGTGKKVEEVLTRYEKKGKYSFSKSQINNKVGSNIQSVSSHFTGQINRTNAFFRLVNNSNRSGALSNVYRSVYSCKDEEIVVVLNGDDWFADNQVLKRLNELYSSEEVWMTYGGSVEYGSDTISSHPIPQEVVEHNAFRSGKAPTHLCSFYSWLFKKINTADLLFGGKFFPMASDAAMMYPMIEMAGERHAYIDQISYMHNQANLIGPNKVDPTLRTMLTRAIMDRQPYERLSDKNDQINHKNRIVVENKINSLIELELLNFKMGGVSQRDLFNGL